MITRKIVEENKEKIERMALKLLEKETLDLIDIIEVLGDRKFPFPDSINDYLNEIRKRKSLEEEKRKEDENINAFEEKNIKDDRKKEEETILNEDPVVIQKI